MEIFNPIAKTDEIHKHYFDFFLTSFAPNNPNLQEKLRGLKGSRYLWKEPYITISKKYELGEAFENFETQRINDKVKLGFRNIKRLYTFQEEGIRNILNGRNTIISAGTGSGKTEIFLIPILNYCFENRNKPGVKAILIYPMNALANDQVERLRKVLFYVNQDLDKKITFAIYTGETPESVKELREDFSGAEETHIITNEDKEEEMEEKRRIGCEPHCDKLLYDVENLRLKCRCDNLTINFQKLTRNQIRESPPDILITNYVQLEHLLLRKKDEKLFSNRQIKFIVLDEIHAYKGARGIDVALLNRRFLSRLRRYENPEPIYIGTSATISTIIDEKRRKQEIARLGKQLFGVDFTKEDVVAGKEVSVVFDEVPCKLEKVTKIPEIERIDSCDDTKFLEICKLIYPELKEEEVKKVSKEKKSLYLGGLLLKNPFFQSLVNILKKEPVNFDEIMGKMEDDPLFKRTMNAVNYDKSVMKDIVWSYLKLGSMAAHPKLSTDKEKVPLIRVNVHNFFKTIERIYQCNGCGKLFAKPRNECDECFNSVDELGVCRFCGKEFLITNVNAEEFKEFYRKKVGGKRSEESKISDALGEEISESIRLRKCGYSEEFTGNILLLWQSYSKGEGGILVKKCIKCGAILDKNDKSCLCDSSNLKDSYVYVGKLRTKYESIELNPKTQPHHCPFCNNSYGRFSALSPVSMSSNTTAVTLFDTVYNSLPENLRKLLIFTDNRQAASYLAGYLEDGHLDLALRGLFFRTIQQERRTLFQDLREEILYEIGEWFGVLKPGKRNTLDRNILLELTTSTGRQRSVENLGLIEVTYKGLENLEEFKNLINKCNGDFPISLSTTDETEQFRDYLISLLNIFRTNTAIYGLHHGYGRDPVVGYVEEEKTRRVPPERYNVIELKGALTTNPLAKTFQLTRDSFNISDETRAKRILQFAFQFLKESNLLVSTRLTKWGKSTYAYVVNSDNIIIKIPKEIFFCEKCKRAYTNLPKGVCLTYRCDGRPEKLGYEKFIENTRNYYVNLYGRSVPIKMIVEEDTGALDPAERRKTESEFKKGEFGGRKVDIIVATPTLELGVDIGDLVSIGLFKSPPSPVNYLQRVGRAGRKEKISFNNTFLFLTPIDKYYFKQPQKLIKGEVETPEIRLDNRHLLQRHINSLILEELLIHSSKANEYEKIGIYNMYNFVFDNLFEGLISDLNSKKDVLVGRISITLKDSQFDWVADKDIHGNVETFVEMVRKAVERYKEELNWQKRKLEMIRGRLGERDISLFEKRDLRNKREKIEDEIEKIEEKTSIISYFMDINILPRYAFPGIFIDISDARGFEDFSGRARNYAITEYAPNMEVYIKKSIYKSIGVDFEFFKPTSKTFYICPKCREYISEYENDIRNGCPICNSKSDKLECIEAIEPNRIYIRKTNKPIYEPREFQEAISNIYFSRKIKATSVPSSESNVRITDYGTVELVQTVSDIFINGEEFSIELCDRCGKVKEPDEFIRTKEHYKLGSEGKCNGRYKKLSLYHRMPTNVISIKLVGDTLFGVGINDVFEKMKEVRPNLTREKFQYIFLTTLKNAIINAAQRLLQTEDGEIEGEIKENEIILFDNVDGGVGYVNEIAKRFEDVLKEAVEIVLDPDDNCEAGCLECLWSYRRKRDIPYIDKRFIREVFGAIQRDYLSKKIVTEGEVKKDFIEYHGENIKTIHSPPYSFLGIEELKKLLRSAKEEIILTSLYVTDDELPWEDETEKSWADILVDIKLLSPTLKVTVIVKEPATEKHKAALRKLSDSDISVKVFKKEVEDMLPSIIHSKLIVIDPHIPSARYAIHTSANFSPEMWKNHETLDFGNDEEWVKGTYKEIRGIAEQSSDFKG